MASVTARRPTLVTALTAPAVVDFASTAGYSPLDQLGFSVHHEPTPSIPSLLPLDKQASSVPSVPSLAFNLFRSPSVYSVDSSTDSISTDDDHYGFGYGFVSEPELDVESDEDLPEPRIITNILPHGDNESSQSSPTTPRARRTASERAVGGSPSGSGTTTPMGEVSGSREGSLRVRGLATYPSLANMPYAHGDFRSGFSAAPFTLQSVPVRVGRSMSGPPEPDSATRASMRSVSEPVPQPQPAPFAARPQHTTVPDTASIHGEQGSDWGEDENDFEWLDTEGAPEASNGMNRRSSLLRMAPKRLSRLRNVIPAPMLGSSSSSGSPESERPNILETESSSPDTTSAAPIPKPKKKRTIVIPRRAAPPPPPGAPLFPVGVQRSRSPTKSSHNGQPEGYPGPRKQSPPLHDNVLPPVVIIAPTPERKGTSGGSHSPLRSASQDHGNGYSMRKMNGDADAFGGERLDSRSPDSIPRGRYPKIAMRKAASAPVSSEHADVRRGSLSSSSEEGRPMISGLNIQGRTPEEIVAAGLARRKAGDLAKSSYLFMKAAEAGSATGRIHWGIALKNGIGLARDERRGFAELLQACDRSLAEGGVDLRAASGVLTPQQRKSVPVSVTARLL